MGKLVNKLRDVRLQRAAELGENLSVSDVAREIGFSRSRVSFFENNPGETPTGDMIARLCAYYNVQPGHLLEYIVELDDLLEHIVTEGEE
jgi:transcriptional regulator with XRE-family HTH domain